MANIKFNYLYRDAANYKEYGFEIFSNPEKLDLSLINEKLRKYFKDDLFNPSDIGLPRLILSNYKYDPELDHLFNEFVGIEETDKASSQKRTIQEFLNEIDPGLIY